jgi:hypothetical protein
MEIYDPDIRILAGIATSLEADYIAVDEDWKGSPFAWIKTRPSRQVGKIGEQLVAGWLAARGFNVARSPDSDADRLVENKRVEIKFSTLWKNGSYKFQQLRDQNYDIVVCLGISPFDAHCWILEKSEILRQWHETGNMQSQHGGAAGNDTAWITASPSAPPAWLQPHGGKLGEAMRVLSELTGFTPEPVNE